MELHEVKEEKKEEKAVFTREKQICEQHFVFSIPINASFPLWYGEFAIIPNSVLLRMFQELLLPKLLPLVSVKPKPLPIKCAVRLDHDLHKLIFGSAKEVFLNEAQINQVFGVSIRLNLKGGCYALLCAPP
ncbi:hypothetical protein QOT17_015363 [Balamuthia mandrillaris]